MKMIGFDAQGFGKKWGMASGIFCFAEPRQTESFCTTKLSEVTDRAYPNKVSLSRHRLTCNTVKRPHDQEHNRGSRLAMTRPRRHAIT